MTAKLTNRFVAANYNKTERAVSIRQAHAKTSKPGAHIATVQAVSLKNAVFNCDEEAHAKAQVDPHASKLSGYVTGRVTETPTDGLNLTRIFFKPDEDLGFFNEEGERVYCAELVQIVGSHIYAFEAQ